MLKEDRPELAEGLAEGDRSGLSKRERALVMHAERLTGDPAGVTRASIDALRSLGISDAEILDATQVIGYMAYVNRLAQGLGVELEDPGALGQAPEGED